MAYQWGYTKHNGPDTWLEHFPAAKGDRQTPIDIIASWATYDPKLKDNPLKIKYDPSQCKSLLNNGASFQVPIAGAGSLLEGGPLSHQYEVAQFHMHWGKTSSSGSEHRINGEMFAAELHIVHWNKDLFSSFGEAAAQDKGLCVLGIFVKAGKENTALKKLTDLLPKVQHSGSTTDIVGGFDPASMLPDDKSKYWTYLGSLTTPPCYESVTWVVYKDPIEMSEAQLSAFRQLQSPCVSTEGHIIDNYRPIMPLNDRPLRASFRKFFT